MLTSPKRPIQNQRFLPSYEDDLIQFDDTDIGSKDPLWNSLDSFLQHEKEAEEEEKHQQ